MGWDPRAEGKEQLKAGCVKKATFDFPSLYFSACKTSGSSQHWLRRSGGGQTCLSLALASSSQGKSQPFLEGVGIILSLFYSPPTPQAGLEVKDFFLTFCFFKNKSIKSASSVPFS